MVTDISVTVCKVILDQQGNIVTDFTPYANSEFSVDLTIGGGDAFEVVVDSDSKLKLLLQTMVQNLNSQPFRRAR
ncbi:MAG: hypothetical protein R3B65_02555 [Candidatus Paceibacterota bacterium]